MTNEAFARIKIDQLLKDTDWRLNDGISVRFEYPLDDGGRADYALFDLQGRALAVLEAKRTGVSLSAGEAQGRRYADLLDVPFIFLSNGEEIWFCDKGQDAHFRQIETVFSQDDLARRKAARDTRRSPFDIPIDSRIAGGSGRRHQSACIEAVCREIVNGRRKMVVEMATGTGKTRTAAALLKRLFEANWATRALRPALDHATQVIEGFQSPFGLELLATVDWLNRREGVALAAGAMTPAVRRWPEPDGSAARKARIFGAREIGIAVDHLRRVGVTRAR